MNIPPHKLSLAFLGKVLAIVGERNFSVSDTDRFSYCRDANYRSSIEAHYQVYNHFPAVIVWPENTQQISELIQLACQHKLSITTIGGSSGICGGGLPGPHAMVIDVKKLNRILKCDTEKFFVEAEAGIHCEVLERTLNRNGFTLGHFPVSLSMATLGGSLATRAAGQLTTRYGKIEDMVIDLEFVDGKGHVHQTADTSRGRGINLTQLITGSEGTLGIITRARLKIFPKPQERLFLSCSFPNMAYGMEAQRRIIQTGIKPDVLRLFDKLDTAIAFSKFSSTGLPLTEMNIALPKQAKKILRFLRSSAITVLFRYQRLVRELSEKSLLGCLFVVMLEGHPQVIAQKKSIIQTVCQSMNARNMGEKVAAHWFKHRYSVAYKVSKLFMDGGFTDTMEVTTTWDNAERLYDGVLQRLQTLCLVLTHITHVYPEGLSLYFTFVAPLKGPQKSVQFYDKIWKTALDAVMEFGGTISHHNGIGKLKTTHLKQEWNEGLVLYHELKKQFDPHQILNPGVFLQNTMNMKEL